MARHRGHDMHDGDGMAHHRKAQHVAWNNEHSGGGEDAISHGNPELTGIPPQRNEGAMTQGTLGKRGPEGHTHGFHEKGGKGGKNMAVNNPGGSPR